MWCLGLLQAALIPASPAGAENARWDFLVTNLDVFPGTEQFFEPDDKLFWRLKKNLRKVQASEKLPEIEFPFRVSTNAEGRRVVPGDAALDKRGLGKGGPGKTVLFLGDSCTFGIPVNDDETFPARTRAKLAAESAVEIHAVNAGVPGYSVFQGRLLLEQFAEPADIVPDIVVVTFWANGRSIWDHLSDAEHVELLAAERSGEFNSLRLTRLWRRATPGNRQRLNDEEFAEQLRLIAAWCREKGSTAVFQVWPTQRQTTGAPDVDRQQIIRLVGREQKVTVVDLVPTFRLTGDPGLFVDNIHCTREGYDLAAQVLSDALAELLKK
ncbi:MAG: SGNH/GDSL hydrolase family protein [Acidobacteria bacterium]|nr:SGNH/GDSL hydrolase family protein [Acidobacteriota bacterium]